MIKATGKCQAEGEEWMEKAGIRCCQMHQSQVLRAHRKLVTIAATEIIRKIIYR